MSPVTHENQGLNYEVASLPRYLVDPWLFHGEACSLCLGAWVLLGEKQIAPPTAKSHSFEWGRLSRA